MPKYCASKPSTPLQTILTTSPPDCHAQHCFAKLCFACHAQHCFACITLLSIALLAMISIALLSIALLSIALLTCHTQHCFACITLLSIALLALLSIALLSIALPSRPTRFKPTNLQHFLFQLPLPLWRLQSESTLHNRELPHLKVSAAWTAADSQGLSPDSETIEIGRKPARTQPKFASAASSSAACESATAAASSSSLVSWDGS